jgi:hypothetical protein
MSTSSTPLKLFFYEVSFVINTYFSPLPETLCAGRVKLFGEVSELFTHAVSQLVIVDKTASSECILQGPKRWKSEGAKSGPYRDERNKLRVQTLLLKSWLASSVTVKECR